MVCWFKCAPIYKYSNLHYGTWKEATGVQFNQNSGEERGQYALRQSRRLKRWTVSSLNTQLAGRVRAENEKSGARLSFQYRFGGDELFHRFSAVYIQGIHGTDTAWAHKSSS